ncbi:tyrosine-protein phosphatase Lar-like [Physella acuta]|uniref:tyrosine-protein phosphatase Lar-like n=1 Tax=Physella acuta TaxID=109671 RepID=UPI0027DE0C9F|nr:tyrosine-protein phosphatase Lar-like [Physella acuta]
MTRHEVAMPCHSDILYTRLVWVLVCLSSCHALLVWVDQPVNRSTSLGRNVVLPCQARSVNQSSPPLTLSYNWQFNGGLLPSRVSRFFNNSLYIPAVSAPELGNYSCTVTSTRQGVNGSLGAVVESLAATAIVAQAYIQEFFIHPRSIEAMIGEKVVITCVTGKSSPSLKVRWLFNGQVVTVGSQMTASFGGLDVTGLSVQLSMKLSLPPMAFSLFGVYQCVAANDELDTEVYSSPANVSYKFSASRQLPVIEWNLDDQLIVPENQDLVLSCSCLDTTERPVITWYFNDDTVNENQQVYVLANHSLGFFPYQPVYSGNYSCGAVNSVGEIFSPTVTLVTAVLDIDFAVHPTNTLVMYGEAFTLYCDPPHSIPAASVTWYKNFSAVNLTAGGFQVQGYNLYKPSASFSDAGVFYCLAYNSMTFPDSRNSHLATLTVEGPPLITTPPINTKVVKGNFLHLSCFVEAKPPPTTFWLFQGRNITPSNRIAIVNQDQELLIAEVGKEWEGQFTCVTSNKYGSISAGSFVTVADGVNLTVQNSVANLSSIRWSFNPPNLRVESVTYQHAGNYTCVGSNDAGTASSTGTLVVYVRPTVSLPPSNTTALIGSSATLTCVIKGQPSPSIIWYFNASLSLPSNTNLLDQNQTLTVRSLTWQNVGLYTCEGRSGVGTARASAFIKLLVPPRIDQVISPLSPVMLRTKFSLTCSASGIPSPTIQWRRMNNTVTSSLDGRVRVSDAGVLSVDFVFQNDSGPYECVANSTSGLDVRSVVVSVFGLPVAPYLLSAVPLSPESVYLIWQWSGHDDPTQKLNFYQVSYREKTAESLIVYPVTYLQNVTRTEVTGLKPGTLYIFYVSAVNDIGTSDTSNALSALTLQSAPSTPVNLKLINVTSVSASLTWEQPITPNGVVRMYQLRYINLDAYSSAFVEVNISSPTFPTQEIFLAPLRPYTTYTAQVRAANIDRGQELWGNFSAVITFLTSSSKPSLAPQFLQAVAVDPYSVQVTWQSVPLLAQNGPILNYWIRYQNNETAVNASVSVSNATTTYTIRGLKPWRLYTVLMYADNPAGASPLSEVVQVWTLPIAPVAPPGRLQVRAISSTSLQLSWSPIPGELTTCNVTSYIVQYRVEGSTVWSEVLSPSSDLNFTIQSLQPWTSYECQVAAFTSTVTPGVGLYTLPVPARTLEGKSTAVHDFSYWPDQTRISLWFKPPVDTKGVLKGYLVVYNKVDKTSHNNGFIRLDMNISTSVTLYDLDPDVMYNISVAAVNGAGPGEEIIARVKTLPLTLVETTPVVTIPANTTLEVTNITGYFLRQEVNHVKQNLAAIVAGTIVGAIALVIVTVFICTQCMKYRRKQRLNYDVDASSETAEPSSSYRPLESDTSTPFTPSVVITHYSSIKSQPITEPVPSITTIQTTNHSSSSDVSVQDSHDQHNNNLEGSKHEQKLRPHGLLSIPKISVSHAYTKLEDEMLEPPKDDTHHGIDNPAFLPVIMREKKNPVLLQVPHLSAVSTDNISINSDTLKRRTRMRTENAVAIAVLKNNESSSSLGDIDTQMDIEAEVIFHERTEL